MKITRIAVSLSLLFCVQAWAGPQTWITNVKLVSPEKLDRIDSGSVLIEDDRIVRVERGVGRKAPAGARRVDGKGYFLTPGLIDSHVHLSSVPGMSFEQADEMKAMAAEYFDQMPRSFLYYGYTTVIDLAVGNRDFINRVKKSPLHPDIYDCGAPLVFANGYPSSYAPPETRFKVFSNIIYDPAQADKIPAELKPQDYTPAKGVERIKADGGICVKTHFERGFGNQRNLPVMSPAVYADVRANATQRNLVLVTHGNSFEAQRFVVDGGVDVLAHGMWHWGPTLNNSPELPDEIKQLLDQVVERGIGYQPTMQVLYGLRAYFDPAYLKSPALAKLLPPSMLAWLKTPEGNWFKQEVSEDEIDAVALKGFEVPLRRQQKVVAYLASKDANFVFGTDTPSSPTYGNVPGLNGYLEMQNWRNAGMSLAQIFKAATINNARTFKLDADLGTIEAGKVANLVLMKMSPLADIRAYDSVDTVWIRGRQTSRKNLGAR